MAVSLIVAFFAGVLLGHWFKILILIPVIAITLVVLIGAGIARGDDAWSIGLTVVGVTIALEIGYLIGTGVRTYMIGRKAAGLDSQSHLDHVFRLKDCVNLPWRARG
jgi:hypothetical protein